MITAIFVFINILLIELVLSVDNASVLAIVLNYDNNDQFIKISNILEKF